LAVESGYQELCLDTVIDNTPAKLLFKKFGFVEMHCGKVGAYDLVFYGRKLKKA